MPDFPRDREPDAQPALPPLTELIGELDGNLWEPESAELLAHFREVGRQARSETAAHIAADPEGWGRSFAAWLQAGAPTCSQQARARYDPLYMNAPAIWPANDTVLAQPTHAARREEYLCVRGDGREVVYVCGIPEGANNLRLFTGVLGEPLGEVDVFHVERPKYGREATYVYTAEGTFYVPPADEQHAGCRWPTRDSVGAPYTGLSPDPAIAAAEARYWVVDLAQYIVSWDSAGKVTVSRSSNTPHV